MKDSYRVAGIKSLKHLLRSGHALIGPHWLRIAAPL